MTDEQNHPIGQAVDLVVYAPIGFLVEARKLIPSLAERGRQQVQMAKMMGQFTVGVGRKAADRRRAELWTQTEAVLADLGLAPAKGGSGDPRPPRRGGAGAASSSAPVQKVGPAPVEEVETPSLSVVKGEPTIDVDSLAISDYDSLAASQVIPRLAGLSDEELAAVQSYERQKRGRKTILGRIAQLQSD